MGFAVHRQARHLAQTKDGSSDDEWEINGDTSTIIRPVPIWLCVFLVISYILGGAYLFSRWEDWSFLDSAYFCFITLTTIGKIKLIFFLLQKLYIFLINTALLIEYVLSKCNHAT